MITKALMLVLGSLTATGVAAPATTVESLIADVEKRQSNASGLTHVVPSSEVYTPASPLWANDTARWSTFSAPTFDLLFIPQTENDISEALRGGHGYSATLKVIQKAVLIQMQNFKDIRFNDDDTVTIGGAVKFEDFVTVLYQHGRELTVGSCICVGATGAMLGGGHGRLQGKHGLTSDSLVSVRMVLWNGKIVDASETSNSDLFWAVRGAGHNFGVVISSTFRTYPQDNNGNHYNADMSFTGDSLEGVVMAINSLIPNQDSALAMDLLIFADPTTLTPIVYLNLVYAGAEADGQKYTAHFTNSSTITRNSLDETVVSFADLDSTAAGGAITAACTKGFRQNTYTANLKALDVITMRNLYNSYARLITANPLAANSLILFEVFGQQGITAKPSDTSAYANRGRENALALIEMIYSDDSVAETVDSFARHWRDTLARPAVSGYDKQYVYENYAHGDEPLQAIYGYDGWRRRNLTAAKNKYDPKDNFNGYHNIPLNGEW
ncbi:FAD binding domain-containing protein [Xylaria arbuscula]|nr:FAD binding domain-containing protein [Xylaria arbuscula]